MNIPMTSSFNLILLIVSPLFFQSFSQSSPSFLAIMAIQSVYVWQTWISRTGWLDFAFHFDFLDQQYATVPYYVPTRTPEEMEAIAIGMPTTFPQSKVILTPLQRAIVRSFSPITTSKDYLIQITVSASISAEK